MSERLGRALRSRKVIVAAATLLVSLLVLAVPELEELREEILTLLIALGLVLIGGNGLADAVRNARDREQTIPVGDDDDTDEQAIPIDNREGEA
jgi:hypothetical protein